MICKLQNSAWKPPKTRVLSGFAISLLVKVTYDISHIYDIGNCFFLSLMHRLVWLGDCRAIVGVTTNQLGWEPSQIHVLRKCVICVHSHLYLVLNVDTQSALRSVVQKFPLLNVLKGQNVIDFAYFYETKISAGPILRMCKLGNISDVGIFETREWKHRLKRKLSSQQYAKMISEAMN